MLPLLRQHEGELAELLNGLSKLLLHWVRLLELAILLLWIKLLLLLFVYHKFLLGLLLLIDELSLLILLRHLNSFLIHLIWLLELPISRIPILCLKIITILGFLSWGLLQATKKDLRKRVTRRVESNSFCIHLFIHIFFHYYVFLICLENKHIVMKEKCIKQKW